MAKSTPRKTTKIAHRRQRVGELYLQSHMQTEIAEELGISQTTVSHDLKAIRKLWRESSVRDFDVVQEQELRKLDLLEREAWAAWRRSQQPAESTKVVQDRSGKRAHKTVQHQVGDPRYLEQIHKCITARRALLGLDAPTRIAPTSPDGEEAYHSHVMMEIMRIAEESKEGPVVIDAEFVEQQVQGAIVHQILDDSEQSKETDHDC